MQAYRRLALEHHPDKGGDPDRFVAISTAYEVLGDEATRQEYDAERRQGSDGPASMAGSQPQPATPPVIEHSQGIVVVSIAAAAGVILSLINRKLKARARSEELTKGAAGGASRDPHTHVAIGKFDGLTYRSRVLPMATCALLSTSASLTMCHASNSLRWTELDDARVRAVAALAAKVQEQQAAALEAKAAKARAEREERQKLVPKGHVLGHGSRDPAGPATSRMVADADADASHGDGDGDEQVSMDVAVLDALPSSLKWREGELKPHFDVVLERECVCVCVRFCRWSIAGGAHFCNAVVVIAASTTQRWRHRCSGT